MTQRYFIIDPGFEHFDSHHWVVNELISHAIESTAIKELIIFANQNLEESQNTTFAKIIKHFTVNLYPRDYHDLPHEEYKALVTLIQSQITSALSSYDIAKGDVIVVHTAFSYVYEALARTLMELNLEGVELFISTMFSPGATISFGENETASIRELMRHKFAFSVLEKLSENNAPNVIVDAPTQCYVDAYQQLWQGGEVQLHPSVCGGLTDDLAVTQSNLGDGSILAYLGGPKWDKGIEFTVNALVQAAKFIPSTQFIFHFNDQFPGADAFEPMVSRIESDEYTNIRVIRGNLDKPAYEAILKDASTYLMLYDPSVYGRKTSGVLWDVLKHAKGKSLVVSKDTWHELELMQVGAVYTSIEFGNTDELVAKLVQGQLPTISSKCYQGQYLKTLLSNFGEHVIARTTPKTVTDKKANTACPKKVLVVRTNYGHFTQLSGPGGFIDYLHDSGVEVEECLVPLGHQNSQFSDDGKRWQLLEKSQKYLQSYQVNSFDIEQEILKTANKYDVIHFVDGEHSGLLTALGKLQGVIGSDTKLVATFHQPDYVIKDLIKDASFLQAFDTIHLMSPCQKQSFLDLGISEDKLVVVPHGVAQAHFNAAIALEQAEPALGEITKLQHAFAGKKVCITVGNWLRDYDTFLDVARSFRGQDDILFVAASRGLELAITEQDNNIVLLNQGVEDRTLHWLYRRAELMFLPLHGGAANNAILEAFAAGTRIVTSDLPSTRYYTNSSAIYCADIDGFITAITNTLGVESQHTYENDFLSWCNVASKMNDLLYS